MDMYCTIGRTMLDTQLPCVCLYTCTCRSECLYTCTCRTECLYTYIHVGVSACTHVHVGVCACTHVHCTCRRECLYTCMYMLEWTIGVYCLLSWTHVQLYMSNWTICMYCIVYIYCIFRQNQISEILQLCYVLLVIEKHRRAEAFGVHVVTPSFSYFVLKEIKSS